MEYRGFIKGEALGKLTGHEDDFAAWFDRLEKFSSKVALLLKMLMKPLGAGDTQSGGILIRNIASVVRQLQIFNSGTVDR